MMRCVYLCLVLSLAIGVARAAPIPPLEDLEIRIEGSKAMQMLDAQYALAVNRLRQDKGGHGASLYSQTSFSDNDEVVDVGRSRSYRQWAGGVGVRVPVLGSRLQWREGVMRQELEIARLDSERELRRRELKQQLRAEYASYWAAQRLSALARTYLEQEVPTDRSLALRTQAGLLLDADRLEFSSGFAMARRDQVLSEARGEAALQSIRMLVNGPVGEGTAPRPSAQHCAPSQATAFAAIEQHPELRFLAQVAASSESTPRDSALYGINSEIRVGYQSSTEWPVEQHGGSAAIVWTVDVPINFLDRRRLARESASAARSHAQLEYELRRQEVEQEMRALLAQRTVLEQSLHFARLRSAAGDEAVRERTLRAANLAGDVIEQLQQARLARYNAAKALVDAELALANWSSSWSVYSSIACRPRGLYVWNSDVVLERLAAGEMHSIGSELEGTGSLLISLDAQQIRAVRRDPALLRSALNAAHERGLRVELLLGEPTWLLPEHRPELLEIVRSLRALPFDGLHLDVEPNQLEAPGISNETLLVGLVDTVRAVREVSPWRVDLSIHPRYLEQLAGENTLGEHLTKLDVAVTLMIYVANPQRVIEIAKPLLAHYPQLPQRIALSTEASLSSEESMHHLDQAERARRIGVIEAQLDAPNFRGITVQPTPNTELSNIVMRQ